WSRSGWTCLVRPSNASRMPTTGSSSRWAVPSAEAPVHLGVELGERVEALLEGRVRREQRREAGPRGERGGEVEGVEVLRRAQVARRDAGHLARDLDERVGEQLGLADQDRPGAVSRELAVARERADEDEAD